MRKLILLATICTAVISCDKHWRNTKVEGAVVDASTGNPIGKANVVLYSYRGTTASDQLFEETNEAGNFSYKFKAWRTKEYFLRATHSEYFAPGENLWPPGTSGPLYQTSVETKKKTEPFIKLYSKATLRVTFKPYQRFDATKILLVDMPYYDTRVIEAPYTQQPTKGTFVYGPNVVVGNSAHIVYYKVAQGGDTTQYSVTAYCKQNELVELEVEY